MALTLIVMAEGPSADLVAHFGPSAPALYGRMLGDTARVAAQLPAARVLVRYNPDAYPAILASLPPGTPTFAAPACGSSSVAAALADGLTEGGPAIVIRGAVPHLPPWRLRDAATLLADGADLVIGPSDRGSWYLLGLSAAAATLLGHLPAPGATCDALADAAASTHQVRRLPPWFDVTTVADLGSLAEALRTMPPDVAASTRALVEGAEISRAVGG